MQHSMCKLWFKIGGIIKRFKSTDIYINRSNQGEVKSSKRISDRPGAREKIIVCKKLLSR